MLDKGIYNKINSSFKKKFIFTIGSEAGFYSELNEMVNAILYCLKYEYQFVLYSGKANFAYKKGWEDYFKPFCKKTSFFIHKYFNARMHPPSFGKIHYLLFIIFLGYRKLNPKTYLTYELWKKFFSKEFDEEYFDIPELKLKGNLRDATSQIIGMIYQFNEATFLLIQNEIKQLHLPACFTSVHIRRGDKLKELDLTDIQVYIDQLSLLNPSVNLFIMSDDYSVVEDIRKHFPHFNLFTNVLPNDLGYRHDDFILLPALIRKQKIIRLLASVEISKQSELFIGTFTSNIGNFLGAYMPFEKVISVDKKIWYRFFGYNTDALTANFKQLLNLKENK